MHTTIFKGLCEEVRKEERARTGERMGAKMQLGLPLTLAHPVTVCHCHMEGSICYNVDFSNTTVFRRLEILWLWNEKDFLFVCFFFFLSLADK